MTARIVALTAAALALSGCYIDLGGGDESTGTAGDWRTPPPAIDDPYGYGGGTEVALDPHSMRGEMGAVSPFDGHIYRTTGMDYDGYATVQLNSGDPASRWAVMSLITIQGGLDHPDLVPGARLTFAGGYSEDSSTLFISTLGCSGEEEGLWTFDTYADQMEVNVAEGAEAGSRRIDFRAQFTNYDYATGASTPQIVDGSFSYIRP